jgi:hypothetical protein
MRRNLLPKLLVIHEVQICRLDCGSNLVTKIAVFQTLPCSLIKALTLPILTLVLLRDHMAYIFISICVSAHSKN